MEQIKLKVSIQAPNPYLDYLIRPRFQGLNRLFVLSFENTTGRTLHTQKLSYNCRNKGL